jgi:methionyl-tRNA formyltransferase
MKNRVVFMGSPEFAIPTLQALVDHYQVQGVVTQPDRPSGRGRTVKPSAIKVLAASLRLPIIQPANLRESQTILELQSWKPDFIVVAAFGQILRSDVLDLPPYGCINVHASLLPRWRGAAPVQAAILHGDRHTGVSILKMDTGIDTGPILNQRAIQIAPQDTAGSLSDKLAHLGAELLIETLPKYLSGEIQSQPQDEKEATYASILKKMDGQLVFSLPAQVLANRVRAFNPWPGTFMTWQGRTLKVHQAHAITGDLQTRLSTIKPGSRIIHDGWPAIVATIGILVLDEVQPEGKKPMKGSDFLRGARGWEA